MNPSEILHLKQIESIPISSTKDGDTKHFILTKTKMKKEYDQAVLKSDVGVTSPDSKPGATSNSSQKSTQSNMPTIAYVFNRLILIAG